MNSYIFHIGAPATKVQKFLKAEGADKATCAKVRTNQGVTCQVVIDGNVSAVMFSSAFKDGGFNFTCQPTPGSAPLPQVIGF